MTAVWLTLSILKYSAIPNTADIVEQLENRQRYNTEEEDPHRMGRKTSWKGLKQSVEFVCRREKVASSSHFWFWNRSLCSGCDTEKSSCRPGKTRMCPKPETRVSWRKWSFGRVARHYALHAEIECWIECFLRFKEAACAKHLLDVSAFGRGRQLIRKELRGCRDVWQESSQQKGALHRTDTRRKQWTWRRSGPSRSSGYRLEWKLWKVRLWKARKSWGTLATSWRQLRNAYGILPINEMDCQPTCSSLNADRTMWVKRLHASKTQSAASAQGWKETWNTWNIELMKKVVRW